MRRVQLASRLGSVAAMIEPIESSRICDKAVDILLRSRSDEPRVRNAADDAVADLLPRLDLRIANRRARDVSVLVVGEWNQRGEYAGTGGVLAKRGGHGMMGHRVWRERGGPETLNAILTDTSSEQISRRITRIAKTAGSGVHGMLEAAARAWAEPFPCRLTTQELGRPAQDADMLRRGPPGRPRPPRQPLRPPVRQPLGVRPLRDGTETQPRLHHPTATSRSPDDVRSAARRPRCTFSEHTIRMT